MTAVPTPAHSRLFGLTRQFVRDPLGTYEWAMNSHGDVIRLVLGPPGLRRSLYLVTHPDGVRHVLAAGSSGYTKDTPFYQEIGAYLGYGLLTSDGEAWRQQRRTLAPLFTARHIAHQVTVMAEEAGRLADRWAAATTVDLHSQMTEYTLRVVGRVLFGADVDEAVPVIQRTFPILNRHIRRRGVMPVRLPRGLPTRAERRAAEARRTLYRIVDAIIERRATAANDGGEDLVSLLLAARDPETGAALSAQEVRDQVLIFLLAGHETTSTAVTFALHLLGQHPDVQQRVRDEVDAVLGGRLPTGDDLAKLGYTAMVVKEAMRLYPPAFAFGRFTRTGAQVCGYDIPPRSIVVVSPWATHRHPHLWPDPYRFDPQRFAPEAEAKRQRYAYFPFAGGPRACIGSHFATAEAIVALATIVGSLTLESEPAPVPLEIALTLRPAVPVHCAVQRRAHSPAKT